MTVIPITSASGFAFQGVDTAAKTLKLPVAPRAVCRLRHAPQKTIVQALSPVEALRELELHPGIASVDLEGPGDPLASMATTLRTIELLKKQHPALRLGLTTLGLDGEDHAAELAAAGLDWLTLEVATMEPATVEKLYAWIRSGTKTVPLAKAAVQLVTAQPKTVQTMAAAGVEVRIRTTIYPGVNAHQAVMIAENMAAMGARAMELVPYASDPQAKDGPAPPTREHMEQISTLTGQYLATSFREVPVAECGCASGCGCGAKGASQPGLPKPSIERPNVAVVSTTGMDVDLHLGQAKTLLIYGPRADGLTCLLETRQAPGPGSGASRWEQLAQTLNDCFVLLAASAGQRPREILGNRGIRVFLTEENIEGTVDVLYGGGKKKRCTT
jgi:nitrogen fixation protein NifB